MATTPVLLVAIAVFVSQSLAVADAPQEHLLVATTPLPKAPAPTARRCAHVIIPHKHLQEIRRLTEEERRARWNYEVTGAFREGVGVRTCHLKFNLKLPREFRDRLLRPFTSLTPYHLNQSLGHKMVTLAEYARRVRSLEASFDLETRISYEIAEELAEDGTRYDVLSVTVAPAGDVDDEPINGAPPEPVN